MSIKNIMSPIYSFYSRAVIFVGILTGAFLLTPQLIRQRYLNEQEQ